ncbi:hypothetical protein CGA22_05205 [Pseudomonas sp. PSB18]|nr:hypothetical protein [Pseudomonas sp. PSB18]
MAAQGRTDKLGMCRKYLDLVGDTDQMWERALWEQSLLAIQALRSSRDRGVFIAGKPCSHTTHSHKGLGQWVSYWRADHPGRISRCG